MAKTATKTAQRARIRRRIRAKVTGSVQRPRLSVFRSNKHIYAQIIDDVAGHTLAAASTREGDLAGTGVEASKSVGQRLAERAKEAGVETAVFDRGGYRYHGNVKALAEGARAGGLQF
jgi:large subunit ribosomal protein L18